MFKGKKVLITGGTGSLGNALTERILELEVETLRIFSRDEWKQTEMQNKFNNEKLRFFIGDIRDKNRLNRAMEDVDVLIHAAALKQVPVLEYNPDEAVKTNVFGAQNIIECCLTNNVETAIAIGTDKAVSPYNTYGATKLLMERLFVAANHMKGNHRTKFLCVRYGNVLGSRGSIIPIILNQIKNNKEITITDPNMTRFNITMKQATDLIFRAFSKGKGGEIFVPKLKAYKLSDLKDSVLELLNANNQTKTIPVRPGEKFHETLISMNEVRNVYDTVDDYVIVDTEIQKMFHTIDFDLPKADITNSYSSDNVCLLTKEELKNILSKEKLVIE